MNQPIIRQATLEDIPAILELVNHEILHTTANYSYEPNTLEVQINWFEALQRDGFPVLVATIDGQVVGYGSYSAFAKRVGYRFTVEHSVYINYDFHGNGIGRLLVEQLVQLAKAESRHSIIARIDTQNEGSIHFHEKMGFTEVGRLKEIGFKFGKWLDVVYMQLMLG